MTSPSKEASPAAADDSNGESDDVDVLFAPMPRLSRSLYTDVTRPEFDSHATYARTSTVHGDPMTTGARAAFALEADGEEQVSFEDRIRVYVFDGDRVNENLDSALWDGVFSPTDSFENVLQVYIAASASFSVGGDEQGGGGKDKGKQPSREARKRKIDDIDSGVEPTILHKAVESHLKRDYRYFTTTLDRITVREILVKGDADTPLYTPSAFANPRDGARIFRYSRDSARTLSNILGKTSMASDKVGRKSQ